MLEHMPPPAANIQKMVAKKKQRQQQKYQQQKDGTYVSRMTTNTIEKVQNIYHVTIAYIDRWMQRLWDIICPLFLQRLVFVSQWNRRTHFSLLQHARFWRSVGRQEHRYVIAQNVIAFCVVVSPFIELC